MSVPTMFAIPRNTLINLGLRSVENIHYQLTPKDLADQTIERNEGVLNDTGALVINTGEFTGRSPKDKFIVRDDLTIESVHWNEFNLPIGTEYFDRLYKKMLHYITDKELWVRDAYACADPDYRLNIRILNENP